MFCRFQENRPLLCRMLDIISYPRCENGTYTTREACNICWLNADIGRVPFSQGKRIYHQPPPPPLNNGYLLVTCNADIGRVPFSQGKRIYHQPPPPLNNGYLLVTCNADIGRVPFSQGKRIYHQPPPLPHHINNDKHNK